LFSFVPLISENSDTLIISKLFARADRLEETFPDSSIQFYEKIIDITQNQRNQKIVAMCFNRLSNLYYAINNDVKKRFDLSFKALKIYETIKDSDGIAQITENIGVSLIEQRRCREAIKYHFFVLKYSSRKKLTGLLISSTMSIADCYGSLNKVDSSIYFMKRLEASFPQDASKSSLAVFYSNLGNTYYNLATVTNNKNDYLSSISYATKSKNTCIAYKLDEADLAYSIGLLAVGYLSLNNFEESERNYIESIKIYQRKNMHFELNQMYSEITQLFIKMGEKTKSSLYFNKYDSLSKLIYSEENTNSVSTMKTQFETEKKEEENKLLQSENKLSQSTIQQQKIITSFIVGGLIIVSCLAFFIFNGLKKQKKAFVIISKQKEEVHRQKEIIEEHQKETIDSINYAKRIQYALLAHDDLLKKNLLEYFVLFKPKDIVSGDFYWATEHSNKFYLAICDCTGHGVPGAFMSLLNIGFLSEAIKEKNIEKPNEVFNYVRARLIESISNDGHQDGMDGILLCIDKATSQTTYAAANNEPILISDNNIIELPKDKMPVGKGEKTESFTLFTINANKGDTLYLYTDGYADQFGGPKGKKFKYKQLNELLLSINNKSMEYQKKELNSVIENWKGDLEQVDDILIIGLKI
jgi:serine phosphatase RsbU (regulator of sigma subunit)